MQSLSSQAALPPSSPAPPTLQVADKRHGYVKGLRMLPHYANMDNETFADQTRDKVTGEQLLEGFRPELFDPTKGGGVLGRGVPGVVWHCLDVRYDQW